MNQVLVNTNFDFKKQYFDKYNEEFLPSEGSFDYIELQTLPQLFIDFARESTRCINEENQDFTKFINEDNNEQTNKQFHLKVLELLMLFGLSFSKTDLFDPNTLKTHCSIIEEDLLITNEDGDKNQILDEPKISKSGNLFSEEFEHTKELINKSLKSVIFLFNVKGEVKTYCIDNTNLNKAPIILVYSKTQGRILFPSSFRYYSQGQKIKPSITEESNFYSVCEYRLVEDHWVPHTNPENIKKITEAIFNLTKTDDKANISIRDDLRLFDFASFVNLKLNIVGLIGQCDDVFKRMGFEIELVQSHDKNYPKGFIPKNKLHPELVLYLTDKMVDSNERTHLAYLFLFVPFLNPHFIIPKPASPMSQTYEEATIDAYMRMKSCCSQVFLLARKDEQPLDEDDIISRNSEHYKNGYVYIFGKCIRPKITIKRKANFDSFFFGSNDTVNYCEIIDESFNDQKTEEYKEFEFNSLQHFAQWLEWESRAFSISFENNKKAQFHERTDKTKISCEISSELFEVVRQYLFRNIKDVSKSESSTPITKIFINKIVAYEDGQLQVQFKYDNDKESHNTYKFYKIEQSPSKVAVPGYFNKIAVLHNIESNFVLLNSWYVNDAILLTLFYSKQEKKVLVIAFGRNFKDRTPPIPIFEIESDYNVQYNSLCRTSEYYSYFNSKTHLLLFTIVEDGHPQIVSAIVEKDFSGLYIISKKDINKFIPLEANDENFEKRKSEKLTNDKNPLNCFPSDNDYEVRFTGFAINENGEEAVMYFNCFINLDPVKDDKFEAVKGRFHFLVYFNPKTLNIYKTIKFNHEDFIRIFEKDIENSYEDYNNIENSKKICIGFKGPIQFSIAFPILYVNNSLLLIFYYDRLEINDYFQGLTFLIINNIKNLYSNTFNDMNDYKITPNSLLYFPGSNNLFEIAKTIHHIGFINTLNTFEFVKIIQEKFSKNAIDKYKYNPSEIRINHLSTDLTRNKQELEKNGLIKYPKETPLFMNLLADPENIYQFQFPDFNKCLNPFDFKSLSRLVLQTDDHYGMSIIGQLTIPEPNRIPLHLSLINAPSNDTETELTEEDVESLVNSIQNTKNLHLFAIEDNQVDIYNNYLHNSALRFIISLFTSVQIVVSCPIVDSVTMKKENNMKLCYTIRSRSFPSFPFLRMTSKMPIFHIGVIGERDSDNSSLLSWITGCAFSNMPNNTLAIGCNSFPIFNRTEDLFEKNMRIKNDSIKRIINVVGSLFTVNQGTLSQVVGFISALSACNTIILEFTQHRNILEFFRIFFDNADLLCNEFGIKLPTNDNKEEENEKNSSSKINVAIFCHLDSDPENFAQIVKSEVFGLIEERSLESSSSLAVQAIENIEFKFMPLSESAQEKATRLRNIGFINVLESSKKTSQLMEPLRDMALIFGQQIDREANQNILLKTSQKS